MSQRLPPPSGAAAIRCVAGPLRLSMVTFLPFRPGWRPGRQASALAREVARALTTVRYQRPASSIMMIDCLFLTKQRPPAQNHPRRNSTREHQCQPAQARSGLVAVCSGWTSTSCNNHTPHQPPVPSESVVQQAKSSLIISSSHPASSGPHPSPTAARLPLPALDPRSQH